MINEKLPAPYKQFEGRPLYASISGGKDSTALGLWFKERGIKFTPIFLDTGWEHEATYEYIQDVLVPMFGDFIILRNEKLFDASEEWRGGMEQALRYHKMFPSGVVKFCTRELKVTPVQNFYAQVRYETKHKPINAVGIRAEESARRAEMSEIEEQDEATVWRPLISVTEDEIIAMHSEHKVPPNPLYIKGASRVGCYPCIYARKHEIRHMSYADPARIDYIEELERKVNALRRPEQRQATFFKSRRKDKQPMGIREIVEWSRTDRGGAYLDDQEDIEDAGCMRWGMCERPAWEKLPLFKEDTDA